jgi:hypothetical protein
MAGSVLIVASRGGNQTCRRTVHPSWPALAAARSRSACHRRHGPKACAEDNYEWPQFFNVITPIVGTANHSLAVAWTGEFTAQTGSRASVLPAPNGFSRAAWLNQDEGRLVLVQASDYFDQMDAADGYATRDAGPTDTRLINMNQVTGWGYMVRGDSDIESFHDIGPGTRISYSPSSSFLIAGIDALLAYLDLSTRRRDPGRGRQLRRQHRRHSRRPCRRDLHLAAVGSELRGRGRAELDPLAAAAARGGRPGSLCPLSREASRLRAGRTTSNPASPPRTASTWTMPSRPTMCAPTRIRSSSTSC